MSSPFRGFPPEALQFFRGLSRNNRREWFLPRKPLFEKKVKEPMRQLVDALNAALHDFAPEYETDPDKAIFRIYRDVRFSKDKKPYKEQIAATFHRHGSMSHGQGGYYVAISHKSVAVGGGVYMPEPPQLLAIRQHIAERHEERRRFASSLALWKASSSRASLAASLPIIPPPACSATNTTFCTRNFRRASPLRPGSTKVSSTASALWLPS